MPPDGGWKTAADPSRGVMPSTSRGHADTAAAFTHYERFMRPIVEKGQDVPKIGPRLMHPRSRLGVHLLHGALSVASSHAMQEIAARFLTNSNDEVELPNYELHATESSGGCGSS